MWHLISNNSELYLFSALIQANAAVVALVGIFVIYKLQAYQYEIQTIKFFLSEAIRQVGSNRKILDTRLKFEDMSNKDRDERIKEFGNSLITDYFIEWNNKLNIMTTVRKKIIAPTILLIILIMSNVIFLGYPSIINQFGKIIIFIDVVFQAIVIAVIVYQIISIIQMK